ncbi:MAG: hypothetical protein K8T10_18330 [Candidatus Eremiobacteraeota bacterium]|nr:hypothetical protein [Candidatus Eremiobacteraeota bacterium]
MHYFSYDGQGNVVQVSNKAGQLPYHLYAYDSYGATTEGGGYYGDQLASYKGYDKGPFGYKTGVRQYDPETGRFLSPDPFKGYMTDPASQHPYMYCRGNPIRYSDPSGYDAKDIWEYYKWQSVIPGPYGAPGGRGWGDLSEEAYRHGKLAGYITDASIGVAIIAIGIASGASIYEGVTGGVIDWNFRIRYKPTPGNGGRGIGDILSDPAKFRGFLKRKHPTGRPYSPEDANKIWRKLKKGGYNPRYDKGHKGKKWNMPHINYKRPGERSRHIPVAPGWKPSE